MQRAVADMQEVTVDVEHYRRNRDRMHQGLIDAGYDCVLPGGAFYMFPKAPIADDVEFVQRLQDQHILVVPGKGFGSPGHFRLAYCVGPEVIERALPGLARARQAC